MLVDKVVLREIICNQIAKIEDENELNKLVDRITADIEINAFQLIRTAKREIMLTKENIKQSNSW